jgi:hypothetical protein
MTLPIGTGCGSRENLIFGVTNFCFGPFSAIENLVVSPDPVPEFFKVRSQQGWGTFPRGYPLPAAVSALHRHSIPFHFSLRLHLLTLPLSVCSKGGYH